MAIREENKIILSRVHGNCVVIHGYNYPLTDFLRRPPCKPTLEVQQRAAFVGMHGQHDVDTFYQVINSLENDLHMQDLQTMVCLTIARVTPDESSERRQEMWVLHVDDRFESAIHGTRNEWIQVQRSMAQAKEGEWATFLAQKAQEGHERRHAQIAEQIAPDHFLRE